MRKSIAFLWRNIKVLSSNKILVNHISIKMKQKVKKFEAWETKLSLILENMILFIENLLELIIKSPHLQEFR